MRFHSKELILGSLDLSVYFTGFFITFGGFVLHLNPMVLPPQIEEDIHILCKSSLHVLMYCYEYDGFSKRGHVGMVGLINAFPMPSYYVINGIQRQP